MSFPAGDGVKEGGCSLMGSMKPYSPAKGALEQVLGHVMSVL